MKLFFLTYVPQIFRKEKKSQNIEGLLSSLRMYLACSQKTENHSVFIFYIMPLRVLNLQVSRTVVPQREIFISTVIIKRHSYESIARADQ